MALPKKVQENLIAISLPDTPPPEPPDQFLIEKFSLPQPFKSYRNWCWAVVAEAFSNFFNPGHSMVQETIARKACGRRPCPPYNKCFCDRPWLLEEALFIALGIVVRPDATKLPFEQIASDIRRKMPVGCRLHENGGHFVVIVGFKQEGTNQYVTVLKNKGNTETDWNYIDFIEKRSHFYQINRDTTWKFQYHQVLRKIYKFFAGF